MKIVGVYSFNGGEKAVQKKYAKELDEVKRILVTLMPKTTRQRQARKRPCGTRFYTVPVL